MESRQSRFKNTKSENLDTWLRVSNTGKSHSLRTFDSSIVLEWLSVHLKFWATPLSLVIGFVMLLDGCDAGCDRINESWCDGNMWVTCKAPPGKSSLEGEIRMKYKKNS